MKTRPLALSRLPLLTVLLTAAFALLPAQTQAKASRAHAAKTTAASSSASSSSVNQMEIDSAVAELHGNILTITGDNFGNATPSVTLNDMSLTVISSSDTMIQARIPPHFSADSYPLEVSTGSGAPFNDSFPVPTRTNAPPLPPPPPPPTTPP